MFKTGSDNSCGDFVNCVDGVEHHFKCPEGLAWHPTLWRCEWPDQVSTCNVEGINYKKSDQLKNIDFILTYILVYIIYYVLKTIAFLGFKCPAVDELVAASNPVYGHPVIIFFQNESLTK